MRERTLVIAIVICAALVRLMGLFHHATMPDEAFTFFIASHPLPAIVALLKTGDFHPPLIYLIGHGLFLLSTRAYLFRIVSALFGIAGVIATYAVARRAIPRFAPLAAFLVAVNPALVFFDGFFRMYALLWSLCMISWALLLWALDDPRRPLRWVAYGVCLAALLYTHYLAFFTITAQVAYVLIFYRRSWGFWIAAAAACVAFLPWLP
ncbi:MAG TPA: glycosyltransferase family 39 protein, partial [Candidatus Eremiobacteraceae bacterium]|nr:glycosyltransferase family 39 protein [Candidatus Eremiobacteraceae bacterium]